ncbi:protein cramped [Ochlerotatus camptorhynchus]|uniref:protein cramped n=1 Tax=Ochlerotatus camptorhynchus TaxID=644619 RepID=UPI0031DB89D9
MDCIPASTNIDPIVNTHHKSDPKSNHVDWKPPPGGGGPGDPDEHPPQSHPPPATTETHNPPSGGTPKAHSTSVGKPIPHKLADPSLQQIPTEELLGSVTTFYPSGDAECGHALRTSARVIHKMRMDSIRGSTPPPPDRKEGGTNAIGGKGGSGAAGGYQAKTPNQQKPVRVVWSNQDKNLFFEALNECGKDFEGIVNYLNTKKRRKEGNNELVFKVKDVRHLYYQFNQKVSKYLHFSDEVKKEAQELYGLINYGEMRKKVPFQNKKYFHKLKDLVYKGAVIIREKGRNIRIKTPSCRALRKLNQLEEWQEEIRLPPRVDVIMRPAAVAAWGRVQSLAQNPRVRISVTLQKRVSTLLQLLQSKWRHQDVRLVERVSSLKTTNMVATSKAARQKAGHELELCTRMAVETADDEGLKIMRLTPSKDAVIHRPMVNLTEFLSSYSICLNSYEQRIGAKVRGEALCLEKLNSFKERVGTNSKRQRHDSNSEKHSPDGKKVKSEAKETKEEKVGDGTALASLTEIFKSPNASCESFEAVKDVEGSDSESHLTGGKTAVMETSADGPDLKCSELNDSIKLTGISRIMLEPELAHGDNSNDGILVLESEQQQQQQPKQTKPEEGTGSSSSEPAANNHEDLIKTTVKKKDSKEKCSKRKDSKAGVTAMSGIHFRPMVSEETIQKIREGWTMQSVGDMTVGDLYIMFGEENKLHLEYLWEMPKEQRVEVTVTAVEATDTVVDGGVQDRPDPMPSAGFGGDFLKSLSANLPVDLSGRLKQLLQIANLNEKTGKRRCPCGHVCDRRIKIADSMTSAAALNDNLLFKQPMVPSRGNAGATLANCNVLPSPHMRYKQSRWWRMRVNRLQLPSQRLMLPNGTPPYPPNRVNNNNNNNNTYTNSPKVTNGGHTPSTVSSSSQHSQTNAASASTSSRSSAVDDHLTKLLEDKISSFSGSGGGSSRTSTSSNPTSSSAATVDDSSCLSLFDISLPSTSSSLMADLMSSDTDSRTASGAVIGENSNCTTISATRILRESPIDGKLVDTDINDISLSSFLGHLDAAYESEAPTRKRESDQMNISIISESSVDYIARFEDIAAELRAQQEQDSV